MSAEYQLNHCRFSNTPTEKRTFFNDLDEGECNIVKYRNIPVTKSFDVLKFPGVHCENVSGVKEVKRIAGMPRNSTQHDRTNSILMPLTEMSEHRSKRDDTISNGSFQRKLYPAHTFLDRMGQGSISEPTLAVAKDRGDSAALRDIYGKDNFLASEYFDEKKHVTSKEGGIKGYIYIKKGGKIYESKIEANNFQDKEAGIFRHSKEEKCQTHLRSSFSKSKVGDYTATFDTNSFKLDSEGTGDFEIAIFLTGLKNISRKKLQKQGVLGLKTKQIGDDKRKNKKKKRKTETNESKIVQGARQSYKCASRMSKNNLYDKVGSKLRFGTKESDIKPADVCEESVKLLQRRAKGTSESISSIASYRSRNNEAASQRSILMSQSSISPYGNMYGASKPKIREEELWEKFEMIFRNYASTSRHSGEVIPKKISTEWMMNVGVVDEYLTEKEADDAFKHAAGAKITMNTQEYKEFLITLSLRMKLQCYEIYRRMCGM